MEISGKPNFKRKSTKSKFSDRKLGLKKKVEELSILCGVEALLICFDDDDNSPSSGSFSWPEDHQTCLSLIQKYRSFNEEQRKKNTVDLSSFLKKKMEKVRMDLSNEMKKKEQVEMGNLLYSVSGHQSMEGLWFDQLQHVLNQIDSAKRVVEDRALFLKNTRNSKEERVEILGSYQCNGSCGDHHCLVSNGSALNADSRNVHMEEIPKVYDGDFVGLLGSDCNLLHEPEMGLLGSDFNNSCGLLHDAVFSESLGMWEVGGEDFAFPWEMDS